MATEWIDISQSAFNSDKNGYIRYANQVMNIAGDATADSSNGMRVFNIEPGKHYRVTLQMRNRFRVGCVPNLTTGQTITNYVFDPLDNNDTTDQGGAVRTLEITAEAGQTYLVVGAWSSGASAAIFDTLNTIVLEVENSTYTVQFVDWDGSVLKSEVVPSGGSVTPPADPVREGYTFTGWLGNYTNVRQDETVTAQYVQGSIYTVTFVDWDGAVLKTEEVGTGGSATPPADPTRTGYDFTGWSGSYTNVTQNETVTATYEIKHFTVIFRLE